MLFKRLLKKRSVNHPKMELKPNNSKGKIIEFIGPPGVGKSTLYSATKDSLSSVWSNLKLINKLQNNTPEEQVAKIHWKLYKDKFNNVDAINTSSLAKLNLMEYFKIVLSNNLKLIQFDNKEGFFLEEGICNNFSSELLQLNKDEFFKALGNRFIVCILPHDPKIVVQQIKKRTSEGGHTVYHHIGLDDVALEELTRNEVTNFNTFLNQLKKYDFPVCQLYVEDGLEANSKKILDFEASYLD